MKIELPGNVHAPSAARRFVVAALASLSRHARTRADDVVLVVSELVTNSVRAGAQGITVELAIADDLVELRVSDDAPGWPTVRYPDWDDTAGRGLAIVEDVADDWETTRLDPGKRVAVRWSGVEVGC